jgi:hypothetical protein
MKYTILGCITEYTIDDIKPYVESINQSGFNGDKIMLIYDISSDTINYLINNGWHLIQSKLEEHIITQRFKDIYRFLYKYETDVIIWTDVKDVVFQKEPTIWLNDNMNKDILAFSECIRLKDERWAIINSGTTFPMEWNFGTKDQISYCAGIIVGKKNAIRDLFIEIYRWSKTSSNSEQISDQAAYNVLIGLEHFKKSIQFVTQEQGFATQLGVVFMRPNEPQKLLEPTPIYKNGKFYNQNNEEFVIIHQYDRDSKIKQEIKDLYK